MNGRQIFSIHIVLKCQRSSEAQTFARLQYFCTFVIEIKDRMQYCMEEPKRGCRARALSIVDWYPFSSLGVASVLFAQRFAGCRFPYSRCKWKQDSVGVRRILVVPRDSGGASTGFCWCILSDKRSRY